MRIVMLTDQRGAEDGFTLTDYRKGVEYDLTRTPRARELAGIFVRAKFALEVKTDAQPRPTPSSGHVLSVYRLPLLDEYVKAGYLAETYPAFLERETREAELAGRTVEVRALNPAELVAVEAERKRIAALEPAPTPPPPPAAAEAAPLTLMPGITPEIAALFDGDTRTVPSQDPQAEAPEPAVAEPTPTPAPPTPPPAPGPRSHPKSSKKKHKG